MNGNGMKKEYSSFVIACFLAIGVFVINNSVRGTSNIAQAEPSPMGQLEEAYSSRARDKISQNVVYSTDRILKLSGRDVYEILDQPELVRRDLPTVVWQYRNESCVLDVYFKASGDDVLAEPVVHYEVRGRSAVAQVAPRSCLSSLVKSSRSAFNVLDARAFYKSSL
jgi:hypothetical protein